MQLPLNRVHFGSGRRIKHMLRVSPRRARGHCPGLRVDPCQDTGGPSEERHFEGVPEDFEPSGNGSHHAEVVRLP